MTSLNPLMTVGRQISEAIALHQGLSRREAMDRAIEMLRRVHIPEPERRVHAYPHQLSGGMRQRVMIAMALSCNPKLLIADEPTTALDVTIQAQILDLMRELQETLGTAIVLITHDMGVVAENADRVVVMYAGRKVEEASADDLFDCPGHPYTQRAARLDAQSRSRGAHRRAPAAAERDQGHGAVAGATCRRAAPLRRAAASPPSSAAPPIRRSCSTGPATGSPAGMPTACWRRRGMTAALPRERQADGGAPLLEVADLKKHFPIHNGVFSRVVGPGLCGRRRLVSHRPRRDAGAGRRERLRQVDGRPHPAEAARADRRADPRSRRRHHRPRPRRRCCPTAGRCR